MILRGWSTNTLYENIRDNCSIDSLTFITTRILTNVRCENFKILKMNHLTMLLSNTPPTFVLPFNYL